VELEYLPAYAPELNPDEGVWRHAKGRLANGGPADRFALAFTLLDELEALRRSPDLLWSCIAHSGLTL
jgi:transposase